MTPPAATATGRLPRATVPRVPRRICGPAPRPKRPTGEAPTRVARPLPARLAARVRALPDSRFLDRLVRGRAWIAIVAIGLMGIVFTQVSLLKLNAGIGRAVTAADTLERQNASLQQQISKLDSGQRIQDAASRLGMVMAPAGVVHYLDAREADGRRAAANIAPPSPVKPQAAAATATAAAATTATTTAAAPAQAPATAQTTAAPAQASATAQTTAAPAQAPATAQTTAAPTQQQQPPGTATTATAGGATTPASQG